MKADDRTRDEDAPSFGEALRLKTFHDICSNNTGQFSINRGKYMRNRDTRAARWTHRVNHLRFTGPIGVIEAAQDSDQPTQIILQ